VIIVFTAVVIGVGYFGSVYTSSSDPFSRTDLKTCGGAALFFGGLGFIIYDSLFLSRVNSDFSLRGTYAALGTPSLTYASSFVAAIFGGIILVLVLTLTVFTILGRKLNVIIHYVLWSVLMIIGIVPVILGYIVVKEVLGAQSNMHDINWIHANNANESDAVASYWNMWTDHSRIEAAHTLSNRELMDSDDILDYCESLTDWVSLHSSSTGHFDKIGTFTFTYSIPGPNPPFTGDVSLSRWNDFLTWGDLYSVNHVHACIDTTIDQASVVEAFSSKDPCRVRIDSARQCAPGWSTQILSLSFCSSFRKCENEFIVSISRFESLGAIRTSTDNLVWSLPIGWDAMGEAIKLIKSQALSELTDMFVGDRWMWALFNIPLAGFVGIGVLLVLAGLVVDLVKTLKSKCEDAGDKPGSGGSPHLS
jgi:hypothetical protein